MLVRMESWKGVARDARKEGSWKGARRECWVGMEAGKGIKR
jgi:hypothetical protein